MRMGSDSKLLDEMANVAPMTEWAQIVNDCVRELVYYGRYTDAKVYDYWNLFFGQTSTTDKIANFGRA